MTEPILDSLHIDTGEKRIAINDDPNRIITFNPEDVVFAEKFYELVGDFETTLLRYQTEIREMGESVELDANGLPVDGSLRLDKLREACNYIREQIDFLFGEGTSQTVFGDTISLDVFPQFFEGILPFIQGVRETKVKKYTTKNAPTSRKKSKNK